MTDIKRLVNMSIDIDVNSTDSPKNEEFSEFYQASSLFEWIYIIYVWANSMISDNLQS